MIKLAVAGAAGRMGGRIIALATANKRFEVSAALEMDDHPQIGMDAGEAAGIGPIQTAITAVAEPNFDVLIEFSSPAGTMEWVERCRKFNKPIVIGTTGHTPDQLKVIESAAETIPVVKAANMSVGINVLLKVVADVAVALGDDYDIEITETHHRYKMDAPSGTAIALRDAMIEATGRDAEKDVIYGRFGLTDQRSPRQIGMHALRIGDTVGEHEVLFGCLGETLTIKHSAHTRDNFARGAIRAADWLVDKPAGLYDMREVLGLQQNAAQ